MKSAKIEGNDWAKSARGHSRDGFSPALDRRSRVPYYRQIYQRFCEAIQKRILRPGERLPSARSLASQLAISRGTIDLAYSLLAGGGYVVSQGSAGTIVAPELRLEQKASPDRAADLADPIRYKFAPFQLGLPALDAFPQKLWSRITARHARDWPVEWLGVSDPAGYMPLRMAITSYLAVSRGILCSTEQVLITSGFQAALGLIARAYLQPGDEVWFEDPGYFLARMGLEAAGAKIVPVPVDSDGMDVAAGIARSPRARLALVTPSHQSPLGVTLSAERRLALLDWAAAAKAWVVEDDYDSEFRYGSRPLPALKSLDRADRVLYVGSFSKVLFPGLRLGYIVVSKEELDGITKVLQLLYRDRAIFNQAVVADFMTEGHFARHIQRMRTLYAARRAALAAALVKVFDKEIRIELREGGMHLLTRFASCKSDREWMERARAHGLAPFALSPRCIENDCGQGLLLGFANIREEDATKAALQLREALGINRSRSQKVFDETIPLPDQRARAALPSRRSHPVGPVPSVEDSMR